MSARNLYPLFTSKTSVLLWRGKADFLHVPERGCRTRQAGPRCDTVGDSARKAREAARRASFIPEVGAEAQRSKKDPKRIQKDFRRLERFAKNHIFYVIYVGVLQSIFYLKGKICFLNCTLLSTRERNCTLPLSPVPLKNQWCLHPIS